MIIARIMVLLYAIMLFGGGLSAYVKAHSRPSLITSSICALLLVVAFALIGQRPKEGYLLSGIVAIVLAAYMGFKFATTGKVMPSGAICALSIVMAVIFLLAWKNVP